MIGRDESHLFREWEIEKEDTTMRAITRLIVDVAISAHAPPGMSAVYLFKLLIHNRQYENGNCGEFATNERESDRFYLVRRRGDFCFSGSRFGESHTVVNAGKSRTLPSIAKPSLAP